MTVLLTADHGQIAVHPDRVDHLDELWPELTQHLTQRAAGSCLDVLREAWLKATPSVESWNLGQHGGRSSAATAAYLATVQP